MHHITDLGLEYSIGFPGREGVQAAIETLPEQAWRPARDGDGEPCARAKPLTSPSAGEDRSA